MRLPEVYQMPMSQTVSYQQLAAIYWLVLKDTIYTCKTLAPSPAPFG